MLLNKFLSLTLPGCMNRSFYKIFMFFNDVLFFYLYGIIYVCIINNKKMKIEYIFLTIFFGFMLVYLIIALFKSDKL